jgi:uncharacterized protein YggE
MRETAIIHSPFTLLFAMPLAAVLLVQAPAKAEDRKTTIDVTGAGEVSAAPDTALLQVGAAAASPRAESAIAAVSTKATAVLAVLKSQGVAEKDVQTSAVSLRPVMSRPDNRGPGGSEPPRITGYEARIDHRVAVRDVARLGAVIDAAIAAGANDLGSVRFKVRDDAGLLERARRLAVTDARKTAETLAAEAGVGVGRVLTIKEVESGRPGPAPLMMRAEGGGVPVAPGEVTVTARVRVVFALEPKKGQ